MFTPVQMKDAKRYFLPVQGRVHKLHKTQSARAGVPMVPATEAAIVDFWLKNTLAQVKNKVGTK